MAATPPGRKRPLVCVVSEDNPIAARSGSAEYLCAVARAFTAAGADVRLLCLRPFSPFRRRLRMVPAYRACFSGVETPGAILFGSTLVSSDPRNWAWSVLPAQNRRQQRIERLWRLPAPDAAQAAWLRRRLASLAPDAVVANYFNAAEALPPQGVRPPTALVVHDVMALRARSLAVAGEPMNFEPDMVARERGAFAAVDLCMTIQTAETAFIRDQELNRAVLEFPHAVDAPEIPPDRPRPPVALFVGSINSPNLDAARWLVETVWPIVVAARPDARLRIVGGLCAALTDAPNWVERAGVVDNLAAEYGAAAVALTPLRFGSGLKIKLVEGLAHGLPAVATTVGAEGLSPAPPAVLRIADDAPGFARAILDHLDAPTPGAARAAARDYALRGYGVDAAAARAREALALLIGGR